MLFKDYMKLSCIEQLEWQVDRMAQLRAEYGPEVYMAIFSGELSVLLTVAMGEIEALKEKLDAR